MKDSKIDGLGILLVQKRLMGNHLNYKFCFQLGREGQGDLPEISSASDRYVVKGTRGLGASGARS